MYFSLETFKSSEGNLDYVTRLQEVAFVQVRVGPRHVVNLPDDPVHRAVRDDHDAGRVQRDREVRQQLQSRITRWFSFARDVVVTVMSWEI